MVFSTPPCKDCPKRQINCHSTCLAWSKWQAHEQALKDKRNRQLDLNYSLYEVKRKKHQQFIARIGRNQLRGRPLW